MAQANVRPPLDLAAGRDVLAATLPRVLQALDAESPEALGWRQPNPNTLLVPMTGRLGETEESYLLKLHFRSSQDWPPSAQFVNPETLNYDIEVDRRHLPDLRSPEAHLHPAYQDPQGRRLQLVCCSATFEFYNVLHPLNESWHLWKPTDTFLLPLRAIERAFANFYHGRYAAHG